ncbi:MAG: hypothetical protein U0J70_09520 [Atopobiaceae bacterium]|jgi:hypothetical protein|nr:hypothetical protein [Atopobiaceae bacterium]
MSRIRYRQRPSLLARLFRLVFALLVVYAAVLGISAYRISGWAKQTLDSYETFESTFESGDYEKARAAIGDVTQSVNQISNEAHAWYWHLATNVPYFGEDVTCAQMLSGIASNLGNNALLPVLNGVESAQNDLSKISEVVEALTEARNVVSSCRKDFEALPPSHFEALNSLASRLQQAVVNADDVLNQLSVVLDVANVFV